MKMRPPRRPSPLRSPPPPLPCVSARGRGRGVNGGWGLEGEAGRRLGKGNQGEGPVRATLDTPLHLALLPGVAGRGEEAGGEREGLPSYARPAEEMEGGRSGGRGEQRQGSRPPSPHTATAPLPPSPASSDSLFWWEEGRREAGWGGRRATLS